MESKDEKKKVVFLFGAGCEGKGQLGLPSGLDFAKGTLLANGAKELYEKLNGMNEYVMHNDKLIHHNASGILYQTLVENDSDGRLKKVLGECIINEYLEYKNGKKDKDVSKKFTKIFKEKIYDELTKSNRKKYTEELELFLDRASFFSFADSLFNFIRRPDLYKKETAKVMKLYYAAYNCILDSIGIKIDMLNGEPEENRKKLLDLVSVRHKEIIKEKSADHSLYYNMVKEYCNVDEIGIITMNYTHFAQDMVGVEEDSVAYPHGRLEWFEEIETKNVKIIDKHNDKSVIFPFIFVQSGVKPVVSAVQIKEYKKIVDFLTYAEDVYIIGYGLNSDDEHIINLLRERETEGKRITFFAHTDKDVNNIKRCFQNSNVIKIRNDKEFQEVIKNRKG